MKIKTWIVGIQTGAYDEPSWFELETVKTEEAANALCDKIKAELVARNLDKPQDPLADDDADDDVDTYYRDIDCSLGAYPSYRMREVDSVANEQELAALYWAAEMLKRTNPAAAENLESLAKKLDWNQ